MHVDLTNEKLIAYIKIVLVVLLVSIEIVVCAQAAGMYVGTELLYKLIIVACCCVALAVIETIDSFAVRSFTAKMVFYGMDSALLLVICIFTGNSYLSTLYCIVLTQMYMSIDKFRDKCILLGVSCVLYAASFVTGWVFTHAEAPIYSSVVEIVSGALLGLVIIVIDFVVVLFLLRFYRTNKELSLALKEADESRARLKEASEQLSETAVFEERNRIAREIHDNAGHSMTTVIVQTEAAKLLIDTDPAEAKNRIISANIQARNALEQMRESVHLLAGRTQTRPFREEIEEIITQTISGTEIKARYDIDDVQPAEGAYRYLSGSLKECLANGIRHGGATAFYIEIKKDAEGNLNVLVSDNGKGVEGEAKAGFGLKGISEGAQAFGGSCSFSGEPDEGFEVKISLPLKAWSDKPQE